MGGFYLQWKYPNTSRKLTRLLFVCLIVYVPIYFLFLARPKQIIESKDLQLVAGSLSQIAINDSTEESFAIITLEEFPETKYVFDKEGKTYADLSSIQKGDSVSVLASTSAIANKQTLVSSFELRQGDTIFFDLDEYNAGLKQEKTLAKVFLWIAIAFLVIYLLIEKTGLLKWLHSQLSSTDKDFQQKKPNFNEFLDR
jgi:hypothetical protein